MEQKKPALNVLALIKRCLGEPPKQIKLEPARKMKKGKGRHRK